MKNTAAEAQRLEAQSLVSLSIGRQMKYGCCSCRLVCEQLMLAKVKTLSSLLFALCSLLFPLCSLLFALSSFLFPLCSLLCTPSA